MSSGGQVKTSLLGAWAQNDGVDHADAVGETRMRCSVLPVTSHAASWFINQPASSHCSLEGSHVPTLHSRSSP